MDTSNDTTSPGRSVNEQLEQVAVKCGSLYRDHIDGLARRLLFERDTDIESRSGNPMVLVIGNHSSGKSTLLNSLLERDVQDTGVAPTDDGFTIIRYGDTDTTRDGAALVNHPDLGFGGLQQFGPTLVSHLKLKQCPSAVLEKITLVDTPGMIDSAHAEVGRGYDFIKVVRWFSERADVVLLLFDPDKPGTTGETLSVLKSALADLSHKVIFVLNKVDRFESVNDFAKAYGALCWNLAKAIPKKDVPRIFSMYVCGPWVSENRGALPLSGFDEARQRVLEEVLAAPRKRVDNLVTRLYEHARELKMFADVSNKISRMYGRKKRFWGALTLGIPILLLLPGAATFATVGISVWPLLTAVTVAAIGCYFLLRFLARRQLALHQAQILDGLTGVFETLYKRELRLGDNIDLYALWGRVKPKLLNAFELDGIAGLPRARKSELTKLANIVEQDVPELRRSMPVTENR